MSADNQKKTDNIESIKKEKNEEGVETTENAEASGNVETASGGKKTALLVLAATVCLISIVFSLFVLIRIRSLEGDINESLTRIEESIETQQGLESLSKCYVFDEYLALLAGMEGYTAYFSVRDIQGNYLTQTETGLLENLGFEDAGSLVGAEYHAFVGILSNGTVVYDYVGTDEDHVYQTTVNTTEALVESATYGKGDISRIVLNGTDYSKNVRGFNIVVTDENGNVVDSVSFDTHVAGFTCTR